MLTITANYNNSSIPKSHNLAHSLTYKILTVCL